MRGLADLQNVIDTAEAELQRELTGGSGNPWLAYYSTRLTVLRSTIELARGIDNAAMLHGRIDTLNRRIGEVKQHHGWDPPDIIKTELLGAMKNVLRPPEPANPPA